MTPMQAMKKKTYVTWRKFFIYLLGGKCARCGTIKGLEIDHIIPVENNAMSGAGRDRRLADWKEQYMRGNLQLLCKEHNLEKREFKNSDKKNGGIKMADELSFEGIFESMNEKPSDATQKRYAFVKCRDSELTFSVFDTNIIDKLRGKEGKKIILKYKKSADGKYNNVLEVFVEGERQTDAEIIKETYQELWGICVKLKKYIDSMPKE